MIIVQFVLFVVSLLCLLVGLAFPLAYLNHPNPERVNRKDVQKQSDTYLRIGGITGVVSIILNLFMVFR